MVNQARLFSVLAALQGQRLAVSGHPAAFTSPPGTVDLQVQHAATITPTPRSDVVLHRNIEYGRRGKHRFRMDVHVPRSTGRHPLVVVVPGGGFVTCVRRANARKRAYLAARGFVVASIDYGTVPQGARYTDGIADVRAAVRFLRAHAERFRVDPSRVGLWGESAGGYLATMTALVQGDARYDQGEHLDQPSTVDAVVDMFGPTYLPGIADGFDQRTAAAYGRPASAIARYVLGADATQPLSERPEEARLANPVALVEQANTVAQRFLILHGTEDRIVSPHQSAALFGALRRTGADVEFYAVQGAEHGVISVHGANGRLWSTVDIMGRIADFLGRS